MIATCYGPTAWLLPCPGDTRPTDTLSQLAKGSNVFIMQNMGPIEDLAGLSFESQLLINVSAAEEYDVRLECVCDHLTGHCTL